MTRDLRLLPAAALGWLAVLVTLRGGTTMGGLVTLCALIAVAVGTARLRRATRGRHRRASAGRAAATLVLTAIVTASLGGWAAVRAELRAESVRPYLREDVAAVLRISREPRLLDDGRAVVGAVWLRVGQGRPETQVGVPVTVLGAASWSDVVVGSEVLATVRVAATEPGEAAAALLVATAAPAVLARPPPLAAAVASLRAGLLAACSDLDPAARGLVPGIAVGDDRELPESLAEDLRAVSLTHITAVSGAHVAMVLGIVLAVVSRVRRSWRAVLAAVVLAALVLLVHPTASVLRSAVMGGVLLVGLLLARPRAALPALWVSVTLLLAVDPWLATSFGFVLSVLATAGLLLASATLADRLTVLLPRPLAVVLAVPLAAQLACLPALALLQPQAPVHGVLANVLAAPAVPPATVLGLLATVVHPALPVVAQGLAVAASLATAWIAAVATWTSRLPGASAPWWTVVLVLLAAAATRLAMPAVRRRVRRDATARQG